MRSISCTVRWSYGQKKRMRCDGSWMALGTRTSSIMNNVRTDAIREVWPTILELSVEATPLLVTKRSNGHRQSSPLSRVAIRWRSQRMKNDGTINM